MISVAKPRIHGLIPAGGVGSRAQQAGASEPKQYRMIHGKPMIVWAAQALMADVRVTDVVVGVQADDPWAKPSLADVSGVQVLSSAGPTRAQTVLQTLDQSGFDEHDWVLVHDAARPGLPAAELGSLIDACLKADRGGLLALPAADTVKLASAAGHAPMVTVEQTLERQRIWLAQTPQMFRVGELRQALRQTLQTDQAVTDEASAMERAGHSPILVTGSPRNHKVTWAEDFEWIKRLL